MGMAGSEDSSGDNVKGGLGGNQVSWRGIRDYIGNADCDLNMIIM